MVLPNVLILRVAVERLDLVTKEKAVLRYILVVAKVTAVKEIMRFIRAIDWGGSGSAIGALEKDLSMQILT